MPNIFKNSIITTGIYCKPSCGICNKIQNLTVHPSENFVNLKFLASSSSHWSLLEIKSQPPSKDLGLISHSHWVSNSQHLTTQRHLPLFFFSLAGMGCSRYCSGYFQHRNSTGSLLHWECRLQCCKCLLGIILAGTCLACLSLAPCDVWNSS